MTVRTQRDGLTLMELVVVLAILAAISAAAAIATDRILSRRRGEVTQQTLGAFQRSILGSYGQAETIVTPAMVNTGTSLDGFVADMGRVPAAIGANPELQLAELWSNPSGMSPYGRKVSSFDSEVFLNCGWRGPYVDLPIGSARLTDGWGRPMTILARDTAGAPKAALAGESIYGVTSLGSDGATGVTTTEIPLAEDLTIWLGDQVSSPLHVDISVAVYEEDGSGGIQPPSDTSVSVLLYLPDAVGDVTFRDDVVTIADSFTAEFEDVPIGPRVIRAYGTNTSSVTPIDVRRGGQTHWDLVLRTP